MRLTVHTFLSIDGVMQSPGGAEEDPSNGFERGGWLVPYADQTMGEIVEGWFARTDQILLGRHTYDAMYGFWSQVTDPDNGVATALNTLPKHVVTSRPDELTWQNSVPVADDVVAAVRELKAQDGGELQVHGSWQLARTLHDAGLIDEYRLIVFPVVIGSGKRLFAEGSAPSGFELVESRTTTTGAVYSALTRTPFRTGDVNVVDGQEVTEV